MIWEDQLETTILTEKSVLEDTACHDWQWAASEPAARREKRYHLLTLLVVWPDLKGTRTILSSGTAKGDHGRGKENVEPRSSKTQRKPPPPPKKKHAGNFKYAESWGFGDGVTDGVCTKPVLVIVKAWKIYCSTFHQPTPHRPLLAGADIIRQCGLPSGRVSVRHRRV